MAKYQEVIDNLEALYEHYANDDGWECKNPDKDGMAIYENKKEETNGIRPAKVN